MDVVTTGGIAGLEHAFNPATVRRSLALLCAGLVLSVTPIWAEDLGAASLAAAPSYVVVGTGGAGLALRAGPSVDESIVGVLPEGTTVQVLNGPVSDGQVDWYRVQPKGGGSITGYSSGAYLMLPDMSANIRPPNVPATGGKLITATVTGYANGADGGAVGSTTASGTQTHWGTVAADIRLYPFGTRILIEGFEDTVFVVEDRGSGVHGNMFDIWFEDVPTAMAFGWQQRHVTILPPGS